ncbi:peroxisomal membrane protein PEX14-like isoform X2 [Asterias rubens]|uniref:peroxisomal membrane protein PEX14-like isoform X1 n=1 Tax=Asterias rubens TaxID=7604 RepID=UPI001454E838|nr:peroxisomal membrane protein PEX14-like isoform X1 [Asterias rubens]XP_033642618.1 peroxisomal membrane protein PEX14-like isoform X2 [Asterias rubens]
METIPDVDQAKPDAVAQSPSVTAAPRENMIETALRFLKNPQVRSSPLAQKKVFLQKKGLTAQEIEIAVERSGTQQDVVAPVQTPTNQAMVPAQGNPMQQQMVPYGQPVPSQVTRWRDYMAIAVIVGGVSFGIYKLISNFLMPYIKGRQEERERLERLEASIQELNKNVAHTVQEVEKATKSIQVLLELQQSKLDNLTTNIAASKSVSSNNKSTDVADLKAEITSLKGLLLNRHQFPATPQPAPIPAWQRPASSSLVSTTPVKPSINQSQASTTQLGPETKSIATDSQNAAAIEGVANGGLGDVNHSDGLVNGGTNGQGDYQVETTADINIDTNALAGDSNVNQTEVAVAT